MKTYLSTMRLMDMVTITSFLVILYTMAFGVATADRLFVDTQNSIRKSNASANGFANSTTLKRDSKIGTSGKNETDQQLCTTKGCNDAATNIRRFMNTSVNPCDNFYEFACGRYAPDEIGTTNPEDELEPRFQRVIEQQLNLKSSPDDHPIIKYAREIYQTCLKANTRKVVSSSTVKRFIRKTLSIPKWLTPHLKNGSRIESKTGLVKKVSGKRSVVRPPRAIVVGQSNLPNFGGDYVKYISELTGELVLQFSLPLFFDVDLDYSVKGIRVFKIKEPSFVLPMELRKYPGDAGVIKVYGVHVYAVLREIGGQSNSLSNSELKQLAKDVIQFEENLYAKVNGISTSDSDYEKLTVLKMEELTKTNKTVLSPRRTLDYILQKVRQSALRNDDKVHVFNSTALREILVLISNTEVDTLVNYMRYRLAMLLSPFSPRLERLREENPFGIDISGFPIGSKEECLHVIMASFLPVLSKHLHNHTSMFGNDVAQNVIQMYSNIKTELIHNLAINPQLTEDRRNSLMEGIQKIQTCQDNWLVNQTRLDEYYTGIFPLKSSYLEQVTGIISWRNLKTFGFHGKEVTQICVTDTDVDKLSASDVIRSHILQMNVHPKMWMEPFYNQHWPEYLKYSGLGITIGQEMILQLSTIVPDWVNNSTRQNNVGQVVNQRQCLIEHYENFSLNPPQLKINGTKTFEENFSDIGGIQLVYAAYRAVLQKKGGLAVALAVEKGLRGLTEYSNDQLFYLNYAQKLCESPRKFIMDETNSPSEFRVLGSLRNNENFGKAWNCPVGDFMNPKEKCSIF